MSEALTLFYPLKPTITYSGTHKNDAEAAVQNFRERAIDLCQRLDEHGLPDGYEISAPTLEVMKVTTTSTAVAFMLKCWGGYHRSYAEARAAKS